MPDFTELQRNQSQMNSGRDSNLRDFTIVQCDPLSVVSSAFVTADSESDVACGLQGSMNKSNSCSDRGSIFTFEGFLGSKQTHSRAGPL
jgi:hypothetical protein